MSANFLARNEHTVERVVHVERVLGDVKLAIRRLRRRPGFAAAFVGILGVTLGISLTVGALADSTIGSALPYEGESELFALSERHIEQEIDEMVSSFGSYMDWQGRGRFFGPPLPRTC